MENFIYLVFVTSKKKVYSTFLINFLSLCFTKSLSFNYITQIYIGTNIWHICECFDLDVK